MHNHTMPAHTKHSHVVHISAEHAHAVSAYDVHAHAVHGHTVHSHAVYAQATHRAVWMLTLLANSRMALATKLSNRTDRYKEHLERLK